MSEKEVDEIIETVKRYQREHWKLGPTHGIGHWMRVERNGILLADEDVNLAVVRLFAYFHDSKRVDDWLDYKHGPRAAKKLLTLRDTLLKGLTDEEFRQLHDACELHTACDATDDATINACFDADRLDLGRVGITPDPSKMATAKGRHFAAHPDEFLASCKKHEANQKQAKH